MDEPYLTQFRNILRAGGGARDIHDASEAVGYATDCVCSDRFIEAEILGVAQRQRSLCPILERFVGPVDRIIDVGCCTGAATVATALSPVLRPREVVGVDPNKMSLSAAWVRANGYGLAPDRVNFVYTPADQPLPFADRDFDVALCVSVLEFVTSPTGRRNFIEQLKRVTKPGGYVYLTTPNPLRVREYHSGRLFEDFRRRDGFPWASTRHAILSHFRGWECVDLSEFAVRNRLNVGALARLAPLMRWSFTWQKLLLRRPV